MKTPKTPSKVVIVTQPPVSDSPNQPSTSKPKSQEEDQNLPEEGKGKEENAPEGNASPVTDRQ